MYAMWTQIQVMRPTENLPYHLIDSKMLESKECTKECTKDRAKECKRDVVDISSIPHLNFSPLIDLMRKNIEAPLFGRAMDSKIEALHLYKKNLAEALSMTTCPSDIYLNVNKFYMVYLVKKLEDVSFSLYIPTQSYRTDAEILSLLDFMQKKTNIWSFTTGDEITVEFSRKNESLSISVGSTSVTLKPTMKTEILFNTLLLLQLSDCETFFKRQIALYNFLEAGKTPSFELYKIAREDKAGLEFLMLQLGIPVETVVSYLKKYLVDYARSSSSFNNDISYAWDCKKRVKELPLCVYNPLPESQRRPYDVVPDAFVSKDDTAAVLQVFFDYHKAQKIIDPKFEAWIW